MMKTQNIGEVSAQALAGLQIDLLQKLRNGVITMDDLTWFLNLSAKQRAAVQNKKISTFKKSDFFQHRAKGKIQLYFGDNFKRILATASETLNIVSVPQTEKLTETTYDKDILKKYGMQVMVQPIDKVLSEMHAVINSNDPELADGFSTFWYVEFEGRVFWVNCDWNADYREWLCNAREVTDGTHWVAGNRHVLPVT